MGAFVYMLQCADGSYYVGSATGEDLWRRVAEHETGAYRGFTYTRRPVRLVWSEHFDRITDAITVERKIKGWSRAKKEALIKGDWSEINVRSGEPESQSRHPEVRAQRASKDACRNARAVALRGPRCARAPQGDGYNNSVPRHPEARLEGCGLGIRGRNLHVFDLTLFSSLEWRREAASRTPMDSALQKNRGIFLKKILTPDSRQIGTHRFY